MPDFEESAERLLEIKDEIQEYTDRQKRAEGQLEMMMKEVSKKYGCKSLKMFETNIRKLTKNINESEKTFQKLANELFSKVDALEEIEDE